MATRPEDEPGRPPAGNNQRPRGQGPNQGPPDLDELWRDFNRKLGSLFGGRGGGNRPPGGNGGNGGGGFQPPDMKNAGIGIGLVAGRGSADLARHRLLHRQEGQQAVITQFGSYKATVGAGFNWRLPYPIQRHELVVVTQIRSVDVGRDTIVRSTGLRESAMLTEDENIVEIKFAVQYRLSDARASCSRASRPGRRGAGGRDRRSRGGRQDEDGRRLSPRSATRSRRAFASSMQDILDRYKVGVDVVAINLQQGGVRPPEQVQAAFDDVLKAGQERERAKNEAQAYANDVVPRARGRPRG